MPLYIVALGEVIGLAVVYHGFRGIMCLAVVYHGLRGGGVLGLSVVYHDFRGGLGSCSCILWL